ncbi:MAG: hypothetical protein WC640_03295 [Candidatus Paceibacterota bacterium]|jgi:hypothetical protein
MVDVVKQATSDSDNSAKISTPTDAVVVTDGAKDPAATPPAGPTETESPKIIASESREEKLRRAKIAMEGLDRTIRREADEKEEEASEEKQQLNKLLLSLDHEKELMELTWVNLDDKRASLKKVLEPILEREDKLEAEETGLESQEEVTVAPQARRELEQKRWQIQESRKKTEEEKWIVEEKVQKIDDQIEEVKQKYQKLLAQEEEVRQKIQTIDEQMLLQQEVLRQQHELDEQKRRQETLKQIEEQKRIEETEKRNLVEIKKAEESRREAEEERKQVELRKQTEDQEKTLEKERLEKLRLAEEERQRQETTRRQEAQQERERDLKRRIAEAIEGNQAKTPVEKEPSSLPIPPPPTEMVPTPSVPPDSSSTNEPKSEIDYAEEKAAELRRALELERVKRENEEADADRKRQIEVQNRSVISEIKESSSELEPLRTLKGDLEAALRDNQITPDDLARVNKKIFPWAK